MSYSDKTDEEIYAQLKNNFEARDSIFTSDEEEIYEEGIKLLQQYMREMKSMSWKYNLLTYEKYKDYDETDVNNKKQKDYAENVAKKRYMMLIICVLVI